MALFKNDKKVIKVSKKSYLKLLKIKRKKK